MIRDKVMSNNKTRYRGEQLNVVKLNGIISAHSSIKTEYLFDQISNDCATVVMTDNVYNFHDKGTEEVVGFVSCNDWVKKKMEYQLDSQAKISKILNLDELKKRWKVCKLDLDNNPYTKKLKSKSKDQIIEAGNKQFLENNNILSVKAKTDLFNQIVFNQYLLQDSGDSRIEVLPNQSSLFSNLRFEIHCRAEKQIEDEEFITYTKIGKPIFINIPNIINAYDRFYKLQLQREFTDYKYHHEITYTISKKDNRVIKGHAIIEEAIIDNMESLVIYDLRQVKL